VRYFWLGTAVLAALTISMLRVAGDEYHGVKVSIGQHSGTCDFSVIIDRLTIRQFEV